MDQLPDSFGEPLPSVESAFRWSTAAKADSFSPGRAVLAHGAGEADPTRHSFKFGCCCRCSICASNGSRRRGTAARCCRDRFPPSGAPSVAAAFAHICAALCCNRLARCRDERCRSLARRRWLQLTGCAAHAAAACRPSVCAPAVGLAAAAVRCFRSENAAHGRLIRPSGGGAACSFAIMERYTFENDATELLEGFVNSLIRCTKI